MTDQPTKAPPEVLARIPRELGGSASSEPDLPPQEPNGEAPSSLIAGLREQHRRIAQRKTVLLELPLWEGKLAARYRYLDERSLQRILRLAGSSNNDPHVLLQANTDLLVGACDELLARRDDGEEWGPIFDDGPVRYEKRLTDALHLELETDTARSVVHVLFGGRTRGAMAIGAHVQQLIEWLQGQVPEVAEELQGESSVRGS